LASVDIIALHLDRAPCRLGLLVIQRGRASFEGQWALPGVLVNGRYSDPNLDTAATRVLNEKARVREQVATRVILLALDIYNGTTGCLSIHGTYCPA